MENGAMCDLLAVEHENKMYPVEVPSGVASEGDLISFEDAFGFPQLGRVVDKISMNPESACHRCISKLRTILRGLRVYKQEWVAVSKEDV